MGFEVTQSIGCEVVGAGPGAYTSGTVVFDDGTQVSAAGVIVAVVPELWGGSLGRWIRGVEAEDGVGRLVVFYTIMLDLIAGLIV